LPRLLACAWDREDIVVLPLVLLVPMWDCEDARARDREDFVVLPLVLLMPLWDHEDFVVFERLDECEDLPIDAVDYARPLGATGLSKRRS